MKRRRQQNPLPAPLPNPDRAASRSTMGRPRLAGKRLWLARLAMVISSPLLFCLLLELVLRIVGVGYPTSFFLPDKVKGQDVLIPNERFSWRFFGPDMAREAFPVALPKKKAPDTVRIFVFGESAAMGDPQAEFGMPRMLEALLGGRYAGTRFEVVNTAMPAINSHTILPIARECAREKGDIWVIYMGNNEVVGPYGAGSVFGARGARLGLVRASLALKATRTGQFLGKLLASFQRRPDKSREWGGMEMFVKNQVREDDPGMATVYANFERNLSDIMRAGRSSGAGIVLSTVASNLKDCGPFGSLHRAGLSPADLKEWEGLCQKGAEAEQSGRAAEAVDWFRRAAKLDDTFAELHFRWGRCALALGQEAEARQHFVRARDLDTLRFRADSRINEIIRRAAAAHAQEGVQFTDAVEAFSQLSPHGLAGTELIYEHVHLNFEGNYLLARTLAEGVARLLPERVAGSRNNWRGWPSVADCARRLAFTDWHRYEAEADMLGRLSDPPFTAQVDHAEQYAWLRNQNAQHASAKQPAALGEAESLCRDAVAMAPDDWVLQNNLGEVRQKLGDYAGAVESWRRVTEMLPFLAPAWKQLGVLLAQANQDPEAISAFHTALRLKPEWEQPMMGLGQIDARAGRNAAAMAWFERVLKVKPYWGPAHLGLGQSLEAMGRPNDAKPHYQQALQNRMNTSDAMRLLGEFCYAREWYKEAATNFQDALRLDPSDAVTHVNYGLTLGALGRFPEAKAHYAEAARLAPNLADAHARLGFEWARERNDAEAMKEFTEALQSNPDLLEVRLNLGIALLQFRRDTEALEQFREVLRRSPTNATAAKYVQELQGKTQLEAPH